jgi:hypothetical protein
MKSGRDGKKADLGANAALDTVEKALTLLTDAAITKVINREFFLSGPIMVLLYVGSRKYRAFRLLELKMDGSKQFLIQDGSRYV